MNYEEFCQLLSEELLNCTKEGTVLNRDTILKNNGVSYDVFCLLPPDSRCSPVIKIKPLYDRFVAGEPMEKVCETIQKILDAGPPVSDSTADSMGKLELVKDFIAFRLVSREKNEALLKTVPWLPFLNLALVFFVCLESGPENQVTTLIGNEQAALWKLTGKDLFSLAEKNTPRLFPASIRPMRKLLKEFDCPKLHAMEDPVPPLSILTNPSALYGASCMLYADIIKDFAEKTETDYLIFPSSIHEVLLFPNTGDMDYSYFCRMIREINREAVDPEDFLSDELYLYTRSDDSIRIWPYDSSHDTEETGGTGNP